MGSGRGEGSLGGRDGQSPPPRDQVGGRRLLGATWQVSSSRPSLPAMTPWAGSSGRRPTPPPVMLCPPRSVCARPGSPRTPLSPHPKCVPITGPVQTAAGTTGMPAGGWGARALPGSHAAARDALLAPAVAPQGHCSPELLQKLRPLVGNAALGPRPHVGRWCLSGDAGLATRPSPEGPPTSTEGRWPGCRVQDSALRVWSSSLA